MSAGNHDGRYAYKAEDRENKGPLTEAEKKQVRKALADGLSVTQTARKVKVRPGQVSYLKKREGLTAKATHNNTAGTEAWSAIARKRRMERAHAMQRLFEKRQSTIEQVFQEGGEYKTILKVPMGGEQAKNLDFIPAADWRSEVTALNTLDAAITRTDATLDDQGQARAESMLEQVLKVAGGIVGQTNIEPRPGLIQE